MLPAQFRQAIGAIALHGLQNALGGVQAGRLPGAGKADERGPQSEPFTPGRHRLDAAGRSDLSGHDRQQRHHDVVDGHAGALCRPLSPSCRQGSGSTVIGNSGSSPRRSSSSERSGSSQDAPAPSPAHVRVLDAVQSMKCGGGGDDECGGGVDRRAAMLSSILRSDMRTCRSTSSLPRSKQRAAMPAGCARSTAMMRSDDQPISRSAPTTLCSSADRSAPAGAPLKISSTMSFGPTPALHPDRRIPTLHRCRSDVVSGSAGDGRRLRYWRAAAARRTACR